MAEDNTRGDDIVSFPVPRKYLTVVIRALADAMEVRGGPVPTPDVGPTPSGGWTWTKLAMLDRELQNQTVRTLLDLGADRPGESVTFRELMSATGRAYPQVRGDLAGFTQLAKRQFAEPTWPIQVEWSDDDGEMHYSMTPDVARAWKERDMHKLYDPKQAAPNVMVAVAALVFTYVHRERPLPEAVTDCARTLRQNRLSDEDIEAALDYAQVVGETEWRKKHSQ